MDPELRAQRVADLLEDNIRAEVAIGSQLLDLDLTEDQVQGLASSLCASILYAFDVDWAPDWVAAGDVHSWRDGELWFARCAVCLEDSPAAKVQVRAIGWARAHEAGHRAPLH
jgi:hypothetical protein